MSDKDKKSYLEAWREFKTEHPALYTAGAVLPITGQISAIADYADAMDRGDSTDGVIAAASFIPGVGLVKNGAKVAGKVVKGIAPAAHELDLAKTFAPNSVRARLAPVTERAGKIGLTADAEQGYEAGVDAGNKIKAQGEAEKAQRERERQEFMAEWNERG